MQDGRCTRCCVVDTSGGSNTRDSEFLCGHVRSKGRRLCECVVARIGAADGDAGNCDAFAAANVLVGEHTRDAAGVERDGVVCFNAAQCCGGSVEESSGACTGVVYAVAGGDASDSKSLCGDVGRGGGLGERVVTRVGATNGVTNDRDGLA